MIKAPDPEGVLIALAIVVVCWIACWGIMAPVVFGFVS